ncbi:MAG: M20/M25/M40 family metallo-hydrolase [Elusimicrobia bacterium]|nr:M20/M25/M40 family metallo-hydrolase [Elusimicrobiota bacterium]
MAQRAAALAAYLLAANAAAVDFDQGVRIQPVLEDIREDAKAKPASAEPAVWISMAQDDVAPARASSLELGAPVRDNGGVSVFEVGADSLPRLADFMHERFGRCGGFFAHRTLAEAEASLVGRPRKGSGPYTLDQQDAVKPLVERVQERELRSTIETMSAFHNRYYMSDTGVEAARWLQGRWQSLVENIPGASARLVKHEGWKQPSVVLTLPGSEKPEEIVVLGGHLDSINSWRGSAGRAPGADDNASGIAVLTEAVRILGVSGARPKRTLQFMGYAAEEVGLRGSQDIAAQAARQGKAVVAVIQFDMTNLRGSGDGIFLLSDNVDEGLSAFLGKLIEAYAGVPWSKTECGYACSDHASWTRNGYPAAAPFESSFEGMNHAIHTERDTLETSGGNAEHSVPFAKLAVAFALETAKISSR